MAGGPVAVAGAPPRPGAGRGTDASRLRSLSTIAAAVGASRRFTDILELAAEEACVAVGAASLSISRWERDEGLLRTLINVGDLGRGEERFPADEVYALSEFPLVADALLRGVAYRRNVGDPTPGSPDILEQLGKGSEAGAPVVFEGRTWGELWATREVGAGSFNDDELSFLLAVANQVAAGLASAEYLARLEALSFTDPLTRLANRRHLDDALDRALRSPRDGVALAMYDVDGLKAINDGRGHLAGDQALVEVGEALRTAAGELPGSLAARLGGDEFCLLLVGCDEDRARSVARTALDALAAGDAGLTMSCGVALARDGDSALDLLRAADTAQYEAKHASSGRIEVFSGDHAAPQGDAPALSDGVGGRERRRFRDRAAARLAGLLADAEDTSLAAEAIVRRVLAAARQHLGMDVTFLSEFAADQLLLHQFDGNPEPLGLAEGQRLPVSESLCQAVRETSGAALVPDVVGHPRWGLVGVAREGRIGGYIGVPVVLDDGRVFGALCGASARRRAGIDERDVRFLRVLAALIGSLLSSR